jgi:glycosyltransferase involved in cell wall biosynthesis
MISVDINGRFLTQSVTGVQRYATEMVRALDLRLDSETTLRARYEFRLLTPRRAVGLELQLKHIPIQSFGRLAGHAWEQLELPARVGRRVLLSLCNTAPMLLAGNVVTIHDASVFAFPAAYSRAFRLWYRTLLPVLGRTAFRVVTVSEFSRTELSHRAGIPAGKLAVVSEGSEHILRTPPDTRVFARLPVSPGRYILAVGSQAPHKNLGLLAAALDRIDGIAPPLVLAGAANLKVFGGTAIKGRAGAHSAGYVTDGELRALYENACCFVYPSLYEGFGIPPLEAMRCGCPVIVSRAASLPEVCGDAALYCDPRDADDLARTIGTLLREPERSDELRRRGLERAGGFTWDRASAGLLSLLDHIHRA